MQNFKTYLKLSVKLYNLRFCLHNIAIEEQSKQSAETFKKIQLSAPIVRSTENIYNYLCQNMRAIKMKA